MGKARGGWSGQGRSPALAGGKGKARVDNVVKKISNKAVQRKPPAGGAGGESSGRARPPPPQIAVPACPPGSAAATAGEPPLLPSAPRPRESWRHAVYAPRGQGGADGGAAGKRKAHAMTADDDETVRLVVGMMTPSETESEEESACRMHYEAVAEAHSKVAPHEFSDPGLTSDETPFNTWRHHMVMDGNAGGWNEYFQHHRIHQCRRQTCTGVAGG